MQTRPRSIDELKSARLSRRKVVFINQYSLKDKKKARFVGNLPLNAKARKHPPILLGDPAGWRLETESGVKPLPKSFTYEKAIEKGYLGLTIFATESVVEYFLKNKPLIFEPHLRPLPKHLKA